MRKLLLCVVATAALAAVPTATGSPTVRLAILHVMRGCHVWGTADSKPLGANRTLVVKPGTRLEIRINCPMDFDVVQVAGPRAVLAPARWHTGTAHAITFSKRGVYRLKATNVQSSEEMNLQTLGADSLLYLTVRVR